MRLKVDNCFLKHGNIILFRKLLQLLETVDLNWILFSFLFTKTLEFLGAWPSGARRDTIISISTVTNNKIFSHFWIPFLCFQGAFFCNFLSCRPVHLIVNRCILVLDRVVFLSVSLFILYLLNLSRNKVNYSVVSIKRTGCNKRTGWRKNLICYMKKRSGW